MVWNEKKNEFSYFSLNAGQNQLLQKEKDEILQDLQYGNLRILKSTINDRTLSLDEYDQILLKYFNVNPEQRKSLLLMYKKQIVINILKIANNNESGIINENIKKRILQISDMSLQEFETSEKKFYEIIQNLRKCQFNQKTNVVDKLMKKIQIRPTPSKTQEIHDSNELEN